MSIEPIRKAVHVPAPPDRAFAAFTRSMGAWWPKRVTVGASPIAEVVMEPQVGGRWFERGEDGSECPWGKVLEWSPPGRVVLAWQLNAAFAYDPDLITHLTIDFVAVDGGTRVELVHSDLERLGVNAVQVAEQLRGGWPGIVDEFAAFAAAAEEVAP